MNHDGINELRAKYNALSVSDNNQHTQKYSASPLDELRILREKYQSLTINSENTDETSSHNIADHRYNGDQRAEVLTSGQIVSFRSHTTERYNNGATNSISVEYNSDIETDGTAAGHSTVEPTQSEANLHTIADIETDGTAASQSTVEPIQSESSLHAIAEAAHEHKRKYLFTSKPEVQRTDTKSRKSPKYRAYSDLDIRTKSYYGWKSSCSRPTIHFAKSGYFYKGFGDVAACYHCGFMNKTWQETDDPFTKHLEMQPNCEFITELKNKGIESCDSFSHKL